MGRRSSAADPESRRDIYRPLIAVVLWDKPSGWWGRCGHAAFAAEWEWWGGAGRGCRGGCCPGGVGPANADVMVVRTWRLAHVGAARQGAPAPLPVPPGVSGEGRNHGPFPRIGRVCLQADHLGRVAAGSAPPARRHTEHTGRPLWRILDLFGVSGARAPPVCQRHLPGPPLPSLPARGMPGQATTMILGRSR
jgi:hypothetical protein